MCASSFCPDLTRNRCRAIESFHNTITQLKEGPFRNYDDLYQWISGALLQEAANLSYQAAANITSVAPGARSVVVGTIRLSQLRMLAEPCDSHNPFASTPGVALPLCSSADVESLSPFGDLECMGTMSSAFEPNSFARRHAARLQPFQVVLPISAPDGLAVLQNCAWLTDATSSITAGLSLFVPQAARWVYVEFSFTRSDGGFVDRKYSVCSHLWSPGAVELASGLAALDALCVVYLITLVLLCIWHVLDLLQALLREKSSRPLWRAFFDLEILADGSFLVLLICALALLNSYSSALTSLQATGSQDWGSAGVDAVLNLHYLLLVAADTFHTFKAVAITALCIGSFRMVFVLRLQPRLAALGSALYHALGDFAHAIAGFAFLLVCYGVWGHVSFGPQVVDYSSVANSANAISKLVMYDYDLIGM
jgi:cbb3-type cytochrome oxidase subunit 3